MDPRIEEQFLELYEESADPLFRHCYFRVHDRELAKDLAQEVFTRTWSEIATGKKIDNLKAFLYRVANNLIIDYYRKRKSSSLDAMTETGFDPEGEGSKEVELAALVREARGAIDKLDEGYRQVVVLRYINDLSIGEIAKIRGESENAVSVRLHRAIQQMKTILEHGRI